MGLSDYWIQSNGNKCLNLFNFREIKIKDVENNPILLKFFNIFDTKKADGSSGSDQVLGREELSSLFFSVAETTRNNGTSIFNQEIANKYINQTKLSNGKTLKELNINPKEFIDFLSFIVDNKNDEISLKDLTLEQKDNFEKIKKLEGYNNLSTIQQEFIIETIKKNIPIESIVEIVKNNPEKSFNEQTLKMYKTALTDDELNINDIQTGLALSLLNEEQYQNTKNIFLQQQRENNICLKTVAELTQISKPSDTENLSHYVSGKFGPHNVNLDEFTIEFLLKMDDLNREKFFNIIKDKNISPKYYSRIAQLVPVYEHLPKNITTEFPDFVVLNNNVEGTVGFSPNYNSDTKYYYSEKEGLYEVRKKDKNTESVVNKKTNTVTCVVYKNIPGYSGIVESETIEKYDNIKMFDFENWETGNLINKTIRKQSNVQGVYNTSQINSKGKQTPLEFGSKDKNGNVYVEKNYTSPPSANFPEGVTTQYSYERTDDNKVIIDYKIFGKNKNTKKTEVLMNRHQTIEHKGNGLVVTSVNGNIYKAQFEDSKLIIVDETNKERKEFYLGKIFIDEGIDIIMKILQNVPANELMVMKKLPISAIYYNKYSNENTTNNARWSETGKFIEMGHETRLKNLNMTKHASAILDIMLPTFIHEFGHYIDSNEVSGLCSTISKNEQLLKIYQEEFEAFVSNSNSLQQEYIAYFINSSGTSGDRNSQERVAEANTILNALPAEQYANRASYLQQYFPRTIAKIADLMDKVLA